MRNFKYILSAIFCLVVALCGTTLVGCSKNKVNFTFANEGVATFSFDKNKYKVGETANFTVKLDEKYSNSNIKVYANNVELINFDGVYSYKLEKNKVVFEIKGYSVNKYSYNFINDGYFNLYHMGQEYIEHGSNFSFYIDSLKYQPGYIVKVNGSIVQPVNDEYIVYNVRSNLTITVEDYVVNKLNVSYMICEGTYIQFENEEVASTNKVSYGELLKFKVLIVEGYEKNHDFSVIVNYEELEDNNGYSLYAIRDINIKVQGVSKIVFDVNFDNDEGVEIIGTTKVIYGTDYQFDFYFDIGYEAAEDFDILVNGLSVFEEDRYIYVVKNVKSNLYIQIINTQKVTIRPVFVGIAGVDVEADETVEYGRDFTFSYQLKQNYVRGDNFDILANGVSIYDDSLNEYTINEVTESVTITFVGVELIKHSVTINQNIENACDVVIASNKVEHGSDLTFTINANEGFDISEMVVSANGVVLERGYAGVYTVSNVTEDVAISITSVKSIIKTFEPTFEGVENLIVSSDDSVEEGEDFTFSYQFKEGYIAGTSFDILLNGESIYNPSLDEYVIENIADNFTITFVGVELIKYSVTYTVNIENACELNINKTSVEHGTNYTFTIIANENYDFTEMIVTVNGAEVNENDGIYTINNVTENQVITISGIKEIVVTPSSFGIVSIPEGLMCEFEVDGEYYENLEEIELTSESVIYLFVYIDDGYITTESFDLFVNTGNIEMVEEGFYEITGVEDNLIISSIGLCREKTHLVVYEKSSEYEVLFENEKQFYEEGDYVSFRVNLTDSSNSVTVLVNGSEVMPVSGLYTFEVINGLYTEIMIDVLVE